MSTCPTCGASLAEAATAAPSNAQRSITLTIPEWQFPLMRATFDEMNVKLGMHGLGELANQLSPYRERFNEDRNHLRFFDDRMVAMAFTGITWGYKTVVRIGKERSPVGVLPEKRVDVFVDFIDDAGKTKSLKMADNATTTAAQWFKAYFEDAAARITPL
jgi:hypothetical protein